MVVDDKTLERAISSTAVSLHQAYIMTKKLNSTDAKAEVSRFLMEEVLRKTLVHDPDSTYRQLKRIFTEAVDRILNEYKDKRDKSYSGLLELREMLQ